MTAHAHAGPVGLAELVELDPKLEGVDTTLAAWLLTGPWHPLWPQFVMCAISLADVPGRPPANLHFPGATHELLIVALDPSGRDAPVSVAEFGSGGLAGVGGYLTPVDVCHQFTATDAEVTELLDLLARACVNGRLTPSTDDNRPLLREAWLTACVRTLAHMRGEEHAP